MKQIFLLIITLIVFLLSACSPTKETASIPPNTKTEAGKTISSETNNNTSTASSLTNTEIETSQTEKIVVSTTNQATESTTKNTEKVAENSEPTKVDPKETEAKVESISSVTVVTEPIEEKVVKAIASDCEKIADKVIEYINTFRSEEGLGTAIKLSGLTQYAEYRSRQLVTNFVHDTVDERAAATALKYGEYIEPSLYGMTGEPYYTANAREAIAKTSFGGTVDDVATHIARMAKNSSSHWTYVGDAEYKFIAVGITYDSGWWYCDIAMSRENTDNK